MERLLADAEKLSGVKYDINNLSDVYEAIHVIQENLDITGTTAEEAASTLQGSFASMKAAAMDVFGALALGDEGVTKVSDAMNNLAQTTATFLFDNLIPMIGTVLSNLPEAIWTFISSAGTILQERGSELITNLSSGMTLSLPELLNKGAEAVLNFVNGILQNLPAIIVAAGEIVANLITYIMQNLPAILQAGADLLLGLVSGIIDNLSQIAAATLQMIITIVSAIGENLPQLIEAGFEIVGNLVAGLIQKTPDLMSAMGEIITNLISTIIQNLPGFLAKGGEIILSLAKGINNYRSKVSDAIVKVLTELINRIVNALGKFKEKGQQISGKVGEGIRAKIESVKSAINSVLQGALNSVKSFFGSFKNAGANIVSSIASGIRGAVGKVTSAITSVTNTIRRHLPFSPAKEGPLKDLDKLNFGIIADGIYRARVPVVKAANSLAEQAMNGLNPRGELIPSFANASYGVTFSAIEDISPYENFNKSEPITININDPVIKDDRDIRELAHELAIEISRERR